ncbi:hypothetical protein STSP2_01117 [Anaerohalosphaera lusitana]|uniref:DUF2924 domain-containing protein n=1 Tax=Anaerohalosphaera lusitana TaxID=1936003 RepID=A0A1U9NJH0_9BACT|nr:DUF2924 domain-containing protein [Anaerohalosphaera lusitana]AQT67965.1 hypothetical protein STSP2_01117 [Anaerohalosphaera lusitana]
MKIDVARCRDELDGLSIDQLRMRYEKVFGEVSTSRHRTFLIKRILWKMQANVYGGLSYKALKRASELADPTELRMIAPSSPPPPRDGRKVSRSLPARVTSNQSDLVPGTQLERMYKGQRILVTIMDNGVRWNGELYRSLSAVAKEVTGTHWNGKLFFGITKKKVKNAKAKK